MRPRYTAAILAVVLIASPAAAQESKIAAEFRREKERVVHNCGDFAMKALFGCTTTLVTDHPLHVAFGSLAPQNGLAVGVSFVSPHYKPNEDWRIGWSGDAVATAGGAWRAGAYMKIVRTAVPPVGVVGAGEGTAASEGVRTYPVITLYGQAISLPRLTYFGIGSETATADKSWFGMSQTVVGSNVIWPLARGAALRRLNLALVGELNGRFIDLRSGPSDQGPSIETVYTNDSAPGLSSQPGFAQFGEAVRVAPSLASGHLRLAYAAGIQQYVAGGDGTSSFRRWTVDLNHEIPLYRRSITRVAMSSNSPNECDTTVARTVGEYTCPDPLVVSRDRTGSIGVRVLVSRSSVSGTSAVPFYLQRTLGGSDINGERLLASFDDYRFRGPHLLLFQETLEHSLWGPIGVWLAGEHGTVAAQGESFGDARMRHSIGAGLTLRAGGLPMMTLAWSQGSSEGHHVIATINTSLLGGSSRPSLH